MRENVQKARERQESRQGCVLNARLRGKELDALVRLDESCTALLGQALNDLGLSARAYDKVRRVARTIADVDDKENVGVSHIAEAIQYRLLDRRR